MTCFKLVRWTFATVILLVVCVQWISCRAVNNGEGRHKVSSFPTTDELDRTDLDDVGQKVQLRKAAGSRNQYQSLLADKNHKHLRVLKSPNPTVVESVKKRIKASIHGRGLDQSNERNLWRSHPKNDDWSGPDTEEVTYVIDSLGI